MQDRVAFSLIMMKHHRRPYHRSLKGGGHGKIYSEFIV